VIAERNEERHANTELKVMHQSTVMNLNSCLRRLEEEAGKFSAMQNKFLMSELERTRHLDASKTADLKLDKLLRVVKDLRSKLADKEQEKSVLEGQLVKVFKKLGDATQKIKPTDAVNKHRPSSSLRNRGEESDLKRNMSREEVPDYEEIDGFLDLDGTRRQRKAGGATGKNKPRLLDLNSSELSEEEVEVRRGRKESDLVHQKLAEATPRRLSMVAKADLVPQFQRQQPMKRKGDLTPRETAKADAKATKEQTEPPSRAKVQSQKASVVQEVPTKLKKRGRKESDHEDTPWRPDIAPVQEDLYEDNEEQGGEDYVMRSMESITTTHTEEALRERTVINEHGQLITVLDKKLDTRHLKLLIAYECSKSVQFDSANPDMDYSEDGTATTKDGESRFYLPFNPNVVFGLKGDVFYHTLFQVFQPISKVPDSLAVYVPPYKLQDNSTPPAPHKPPPIKRGKKQPPHSESCGVNCRHLTKNVRPKVREDMVLVLKKQELVI
jgi:hypothetical protein